MPEDEATFSRWLVKNVCSIVKMLPQVPHPGFALALAWLMLRQDPATRVKRCDDDADDLLVIANLVAGGVGVDSALHATLNNTSQTDRLKQACDGLSEKDLVLSPELTAHIGREIRWGVLEVMKRLKTDDQSRYMLRLFIREIPPPDEAVEKLQESQ